MSGPSGPVLLRDRGQVHVSTRAAHEFATFSGRPPEEARRRLTELLLEARLQADGTWRRRNRAERVDITAHVMAEGSLQVVTHVHCRHHHPRRGGQRRDD